MAIPIFSILGVVCAFLGLSVALLALIALLPVNLYNAILSCIKLRHAVLISNMIPTYFFVGNIIVALVSLGLFYTITRREQQQKKKNNVRGGGNVRGSSTASSTKKSAVQNNQISNHNVFSHHKHSLMNGYTYAYVTISVLWALIGSLLLHILVSNGTTDEDKLLLLMIYAMKSQLSTLWVNIFVLTAALCTMGLSSLCFILGRRKRNHEETRPLISAV